MNANIFGERIRKLRKEAGLTQKELAERIWLSKTVVSNYELGTRKPSIDIVVKFANYFHVSTDYLLGVEPNQNNFDIDGLTEEDIRLIEYTIKVLKCKNNHSPDRR